MDTTLTMVPVRQSLLSEILIKAHMFNTKYKTRRRKGYTEERALRMKNTPALLTLLGPLVVRNNH